MLRTRIITAIVLLSLVGLSLFYWPPYTWMILCAALLGASSFEWSRFAGFSSLGQNLYIISTLFLSYLLVTFSSVENLYILYGAAAVFWCLFTPFWLKYQWVLSSRAYIAAIVGWLIVLPAFDVLYRVRFSPVMIKILLSMALIVWISDSAAYFVGRVFGRRKLAPSISPGKTWEGVFGAVLATSIYALVLIYCGLPMSWLLITWFFVYIGIVGDLLESLFKRQADLKDSSQLLPGHGGVLDRLDSLFALLPFAGLIMLSLTIG